MSAAIAACYPVGVARAMLFYGSCLRGSVGEDALAGQMLDFYVIVSDYAAAYGRGWNAFANRLLPPNVFPFAQDELAAKYAVLSAADFARLCRPEAASVSVWARFAQPARLVWCADEAARAEIVAAIGETGPTLFELTLPMLEASAGHAPLDVWRRGFALTYAAELRAERVDRSGSIVDADPARYEAFGRAALASIAARRGVGPNGEVANLASPDAMRQRWRRLRWRGKLLTLARLAKATTTFSGGLDYLAWKINRHAGTAIAIRPWQRRAPLLGALVLLPRLLAKGAVR